MEPSVLFAPTLPSLPDVTQVSLGLSPQQALVFRAGLELCAVGASFNALVSPSLSLPPPANALGLTATMDALAISGWFNYAFADIAYVNTLLSEAGYNVP